MGLLEGGGEGLEGVCGEVGGGGLSHIFLVQNFHRGKFSKGRSEKGVSMRKVLFEGFDRAFFRGSIGHFEGLDRTCLGRSDFRIPF